MRYLVLALLATAALLVGPASTSQAAVEGSRSVLHYGDSLTLGTGIYLPGFLPGWSVRQSGAVSRHAEDGAQAVRSLSSSLPRVLVLSLGTNDDPSAVGAFAEDVRRVALAAGGNRCVIWSTVARPPYNGISYDGYNRVLRRAAATYANFRVFDWEALAEAHPGWFGPDGVHPTASGYRARALALARLVKSC